jgi:hypothetical protein
MTPLFGSRQRAEDFAARVDGTSSELVAASADAARQSDVLVDIVTALRQHADEDLHARPRPAFADSLRDRLVAEASAMGRQVRPSGGSSSPGLRELPVRPHRVRERLTVVGASALIIVGGTVGVSNAAQGALPGQALYSVKRSIEAVDAGLAESPSAHGRVLLEQASTRLQEVKGLDAEGPLERQLIPATLDEFTRQAHAGARLLLQGYRETDDPKSIEEVRTFAANQLPVLERLSTSTSDGARSQLRDAAVALRSIDSDASQECSACSDLAPLDSTMTMASMDVSAGRSSSSTLDDGSTDGTNATDPSSDGSTSEGSPSDLTGSAAGATSGDVAVGPEAAAVTPAGPGEATASSGSQPTGSGLSATGGALEPGSSGLATAPGSMGPSAVPTTGGTTVTSVPPRVPVSTVPSSGASPSAGATPAGVVAPSAGASQPTAPAASTPAAPSTSATPSGDTGGASTGSGGTTSSGTTSSGTTSSGTSGSGTTSSGATSSGTTSTSTSGTTSTGTSSGTTSTGTSGSGTTGSGTSSTGQVTAKESEAGSTTTAGDALTSEAHNAYRRAVLRHLHR